MDKKFVDAFLAGTVDVIKTMAFIETKPGKPYMKNDNVASGDISGIIGLTGGVIGSLALSFSEVLYPEDCLQYAGRRADHSKPRH